MTIFTQQNYIDVYGLNELIQVTNPGNPTASAVNSAVFDQLHVLTRDEMASDLQGLDVAALFESPSNILIACALRIFRYHGHGDNPSDRMIADYKQSIDRIRRMSAGKAGTGLDSLGQENPQKRSAFFSRGTQIFNDDLLGKY